MEISSGPTFGNSPRIGDQGDQEINTLVWYVIQVYVNETFENVDGTKRPRTRLSMLKCGYDFSWQFR
jgi:hypothetical protein